MSIPSPGSHGVVLGFVFFALLAVGPTLEARRQSPPLPKEAAALMPKAAGPATGTWVRLSSMAGGDVSAKVQGTTACDAESLQGEVKVNVFADLRDPRLILRNNAAEKEYLQDIAKAEAAAREPRPAGTERFEKVGPARDEILPNGRLFSREFVSLCVASGTRAGRTDTEVNGFARKGNVYYRFSVKAPMPASAARALAAEILANIQRIDLPLGR